MAKRSSTTNLTFSRPLAAAICLSMPAYTDHAQADGQVFSLSRLSSLIAAQESTAAGHERGPAAQNTPAHTVEDAASCSGLTPTVLVIVVREQPLAFRWDLSLAMLRALSAQVPHRSTHATLGFYAGSIGFLAPRLRLFGAPSVERGLGVICPQLEIRSELVALDRQIAIASDLRNNPCLLRAATAHYERHADIASRALRSFAAELPMTLGPEIDRYVRSQPSPPGVEDDQLRGFVEGLLSRSVSEFTTRLVESQEAGDTPDEVRSLAPCDNI